MKNKKKIERWLNIRKKKLYFSVKKKNISKLKKWILSSKKIHHVSGKFFQILGIRINSNFFINSTWDQPIIFQNEKGILGIIRYYNRGKSEYLLQAKAEPGNINKLQLSPTVQATRSNYSRVHSGKEVKYLNFFKNLNRRKVLINSLQTEQGGRYLYKQNRNIMINITSKIKPNTNYIWLSKQEINECINKNNFLNMDSISVFSCAIKKNFYDIPKNSMKNINAWFKKLKRKYFIKRKIIPLSNMKSWNYDIIEGADKTVTLLAEVPGLCDEIKIDFSNNLLVIHGPRKFLKSIKMKQKLELLDYKCINGILNINFKKIV